MKKFIVTVKEGQIEEVEADFVSFTPVGQLSFLRKRPRIATPDNPNTEEVLAFQVFNEWVKYIDTSFLN